MRTCQCGRQDLESNNQHFSWIKHATQAKYLGVCRHLSWVEFQKLVAKWPPGWIVAHVARRASRRHYLNVIAAYCKMQAVVQQAHVNQSGSLTVTVTGRTAKWLSELLLDLKLSTQEGEQKKRAAEDRLLAALSALTAWEAPRVAKSADERRQQYEKVLAAADEWGAAHVQARAAERE